jgi:L-alanine-DL-glutamate epimerase-like enolase superfamily enzyme
MSTSQLESLKGVTNGHDPEQPGQSFAKIKSVEYFRVKPRWLFVKICDDKGNFGWGEATLEGHTRAVEGALDEIIERIVGLEAEYVYVRACVRACMHACMRHFVQFVCFEMADCLNSALELADCFYSEFCP